MKWLLNMFSRQEPQKTVEFSTFEQKTKAGIDFTIKNYGKTLTDLASYDRGEIFSR